MLAVLLGVSLAKDPVCGMYVDESRAEFKATVRGTTYYFCSELISGFSQLGCENPPARVWVIGVRLST